MMMKERSTFGGKHHNNMYPASHVARFDGLHRDQANPDKQVVDVKAKHAVNDKSRTGYKRNLDREDDAHMALANEDDDGCM